MSAVLVPTPAPPSRKARILASVKCVLKDPRVRPLEVWLARIAIAYVLAKLGITAAQLTK